MKKPHLFAALLLALPVPVALSAPAAPTTNVTTTVVDKVDDLIEQGRDKLAKNEAAAARALFDSAAALPGGEERAVIWQIRASMGIDSMNDVLKRIDQLARTRDDAGIDYLFGMAFAVKAQQALDAGLTDGTIGMQMADSQTFLASAVKANGKLYSDAYPTLAHVAYMNSDMDAAINAADKAIGYYPESATSWGRRGRIQLQRFIKLQSEAGEDEAQLAAAITVGEDAVKSLEKAIKFIGTSTSDGRVTERAELYEQLALTHAWLENPTAMQDAYANAMAWDPSILDFGQLWNTLGGGFVKTLTKGHERFTGRWGSDSPADATLLWYLGYARYTALQQAEREFNDDASAEFDQAAAELKASVTKWPAYSNGLWYAGLALYATGDFVGAADTFIDFWQLDPSGTVATFEADKERSLPRIEYIIGQLVDSEGLRSLADLEKLRKAATLAEICANTVKPAGIHWSYQGLFLRDYGDAMERNRQFKPGSEESLEIFEASLAAYERALALEPENPNFMNDLAVVLHYNLNRDLERALKLYTEAEVIAQRLMDDPEVSEERKQQFITIALTDSGNNRRILARQLEKAKREKEDEDKPE